MHAVTRLANLLYPPVCALCHAPTPIALPPRTQLVWGRAPGGSTLFCADCLSQMPRSGPPVCVRCGVELPGAFDAALTCPGCQRRPPAFQTARAPWQYAGCVPEAIRQFKYHRRWRIGRWLSEEMARAVCRSWPLDAIDAVVPVPSHWLKRRLRGWNPSGYLSQAVSRALGKPHHPKALRQTRWTRTQTRLPWAGRFRNVRHAFAAKRRFVDEKTVLLVDDVLTSGATAEACALALREAGARHVFVLTAARTPSHER